MAYKPKHQRAEIGTSSVADIAFLLLSFFLMTTIIDTDKGLALQLPEWRDTPIESPVHQRNLFNVHLNSWDEIMIEGERSSIAGLRKRIQEFVLNNGVDPELSEAPEDAIVSLQTDRGTSHGIFIQVLDEIQGAYYELYAERSGLTTDEYRKLDPNSPEDRKIIEKAKMGLPMNISLAQPTVVGK